MYQTAEDIQQLAYCLCVYRGPFDTLEALGLECENRLLGRLRKGRVVTMTKTKKIFVIKCKYQERPWEDVDSAETYLEAKRLYAEYVTAFQGAGAMRIVQRRVPNV